MPDNTAFQTQIDGRVATAADLAPLAFAGFAHFSAMQVRDGHVKGIDLHLERLRSASLALFATAIPDEQLRHYLRIVIENGPPELSLTVTMFSRAGEFTVIGTSGDPAVLVRSGPASAGPTGPLKLALVEHERWLPGIKQVGESAKTHLLRQAVEQGFDDTAFIDRAGRIGEATIWNLAFWDGETVIWPEANVLPGVTMGILRRQLDRLGVAQRKEQITLKRLQDLAGAVVMNSWTPGVAVRGIGSIDLPTSDTFVDLLRQAYDAEPMGNV